MCEVLFYCLHVRGLGLLRVASLWDFQLMWDFQLPLSVPVPDQLYGKARVWTDFT